MWNTSLHGQLVIRRPRSIVMQLRTFRCRSDIETVIYRSNNEDGQLLLSNATGHHVHNFLLDLSMRYLHPRRKHHSMYGLRCICISCSRTHHSITLHGTICCIHLFHRITFCFQLAVASTTCSTSRIRFSC